MRHRYYDEDDYRKQKLQVYIEKESGTIFYLDEDGELVPVVEENNDKGED